RAKLPVLDLAGNYERVAKVAMEGIAPDLAQMGLALPAFYVENISLPPEVEQALDKRTQMGVLGDLNQYTKFQAANAIPEAAATPGGLGGVGASIAAGAAIGGQMAGALGQGLGSQPTPPPLPASGPTFYMAQDGKQAGPFDLEALAARAREGSLTRGTLV